MSKLRCGLIINPAAGVGGETGFHGSDGDAVQKAAQAQGAVSPAPQRAERALSHAMLLLDGEIDIVTGGGVLGEEAASRVGLTPTVVYQAGGEQTTAADTIALARALCEAKVDVLVFAGGDGTARDVCDAVGAEIPVLGIPAGVKMHSGVFAITPEDVGFVLRSMVMGTSSTELVEVVDIDEDARRSGVLRSRIYGHVRIPRAPKGIQRGKRSSMPSGPEVLHGIAAELADRMRPGVITVFGPGTTTQALGSVLGLELSLLGVDVVCDGALIGRDVAAGKLSALVGDKRFLVVVSPIGGQGVIFGRGNQQINAEVLERLDRRDLVIVCTPEKLGQFAGRALLVDAPNTELNQKFAGPVRVVTGYRQEAVLRIA